MLCGKRAFRGDTSIDTMTAILKEDPPDLPVAERRIPPALARIIDRCLEKSPAARFHSMHDLSLALETLSSHSETSVVLPSVVPGRARAPWLPWALFAVAVMAAVAVGAWSLRSAESESPTYRSSILPPNGTRLLDGAPARLFALSPDGRRLAFVGIGIDRRRVLWVQSLDSLTAQPLAGTEDAYAPFWSPDSRSIGFFAGAANGKLKKIDVGGGPPLTLCDFRGSPAGADWNRSGTILFTTTGAGSGGGAIRRVSAAGGEASDALVPERAESGDEVQYWWPFFLPDDRHFLFFAVTATRVPQGIFVGSLDASDRKLLVRGGSNAKYAQGHLLFLRESTLVAQPFDADRLELSGEAVPVAEQVQRLPPTGAFSVSQTGVLAFLPGSSLTGNRLTWLDQSGRETGKLAEPGSYADLTVSPDGRRVMVSAQEPGGSGRDLWMIDVARDLPTRFTFDPGDDTVPLWSPDGSRVVFSGQRGKQVDLYEKPSSGAGAESLLFSDASIKFPLSWSPDGRFILYVKIDQGPDLWVLPLTGDRKPFPFLATPFNEIPARFSPDGKWIAYASNESGRPEVYVAPFPGPGGKWQVSNAGGNSPQWSRDGRSIFYEALQTAALQSVPVKAGAGLFEIGQPRLFANVRLLGPRSRYDLAPDGRALVALATDSETTSPMTLVVNWLGQVKH
jgi:Tol biopolymer transport system component